jgi:phosphatidylserine/phosphatidylglycerophosphate/cardiolipin synthase-like enzyme
VRVRVIVDQLSALKKADTLAAIASQHVNFDVRVYNPIFNDSRLHYPQYLLASICCWHRLNQRMHSKLLLVDDAVGITGGANYQDDYYDWNAVYDFRDRDVLVAGPVALDMAGNFEAFWDSQRSVPAERLDDVAARAAARRRPAGPARALRAPERVAAMSRDASDPGWSASAWSRMRWTSSTCTSSPTCRRSIAAARRTTSRPPARACARWSKARIRKCCCRRLTWSCPTTRRRCSAACSRRRNRRAW